MAEYDKAVKGVIAAYVRALEKCLPGIEPWPSRKRDKEALILMLDEVKYLRSITKPVPKALGDLSDLPDELLAELSAIKTDDLEDQIFTIIKADGGESNIDTILIELFRRFNVVQKRTYLTNKLWRMTQKEGLIWASEGKGFYTTNEPSFADKLSTRLENGIKPVVDSTDDEIPF